MKTRNDELHDMFKVIAEKKKNNEMKRKQMIEQKEKSVCTFMPKVEGLNKDMFINRPNNMSLVYNDGYVSKMNKIRRDKILSEIERSMKMEKKCNITIPKEFSLHNKKYNCDRKNNKEGNNSNGVNTNVCSSRNSLTNNNKNNNKSEHNKLLEHKLSLAEICNYYNTNNPNLHTLPFSKAKEKLHSLLHQDY
jgi:hypothetical protein